MKRIKLAKQLSTLLIIYFVVYNTYFGWNRLPINEAERICDYIFKAGVYFSIGIYLSPLLNIYEKFINKNQ